MTVFAERLAAAQIIALDCLVRIARDSDDETEARLAAVAILRATSLGSHPPPAASAPGPTPPRAPSPDAPPPRRTREPSLRDINRLINALDRPAPRPASRPVPGSAPLPVASFQHPP